MGILIGFANVALYCMCVVFVAFTLLWLMGLVGYPPSPDMVRIGKIIVVLLCVIAILIWLAGLLGFGGGFPNYFLGSQPPGYQR